MATYPTFNQLPGSRETGSDGIRVDYASDGTVKAQCLYTFEATGFEVKHVLDNTDKETLMTFYDTNKMLSITFGWMADGESYTCIFKSRPKCDPIDNEYWSITTELIRYS